MNVSFFNSLSPGRTIEDVCLIKKFVAEIQCLNAIRGEKVVV